MTLGSRIRKQVFWLLFMAVLTMVGVAWYVDFASNNAVNNAYASANHSTEERRRDQMSWTGQGVLGPIATQVSTRRLDLIAQAQELGGSPLAVRALASKDRGTRQKAMDDLLRGRQSLVHAARVVNSRGQVVAGWKNGKHDDTLLGQSLAKDSSFGQIKGNRGLWDQALVMGYRLDAPDKKRPKKGAKPPKPGSGGGEEVMVVGYALKNRAGRFAGLVELQFKVESLFGLSPEATIKPLRDASKNAVLMLLQGTGLQYYNSKPNKAFREVFNVRQDFKRVLSHMSSEPKGGEPLNYDGKDGMIVWHRIGYWDADIHPPDQLHVLAAFLPNSDFAEVGRSGGKIGTIFFDPIFWGIIVLLGGGLLVIGMAMIKGSLAPLSETAAGAAQIDEFGLADEPLEFPEYKWNDVGAITSAMNLLMQRAATTEQRVKQLDESLRRQEEQAGREATEHTGEIKSLREKLTAAESQLEGYKGKANTSDMQLKDLQAKMSNLQAAVDTAQKSLDLKNSQNKSLNDQVREMMAAVEEQRKIAEEATTSTVSRSNEEVRLEAVKTLSGELKATLGVIKNYISTMLGSVGKISDAQQEFLGVVINKSARLERLINDLVDLSQIGSGLAAPKLEKMDVGALIREVILNVQVQADHKKITLDFAEGGGMLEARADRERLTQVLRILLTQAIKVTARGEKISVLASARENQVEIRISDPGMSLPPDRAEKVFSLFHGVDSQAGPEFIGTGLRFPIVKAVVQAHGGSVRIESQVGRGKTFVLALSKDGTPAAMSAKAPAGPPPVPVLASKPPAPGLGKPAAPPPPPGSPKPTAPSFGGGDMPTPGVKPAAPPPPPGAKPAPPSKGDMAAFDKIFGGPPGGAPKPPAPPPPPPGAKPGPPPPPGAKPAPPSKADMANFEKAFGGAPAPPPPPGGPKGPPPPPGAKPAPPNKADMAKFDKIFGGAPAGGPPAGAPPLGKPNPPLSKSDTANFDKIFGGGTPPPPPPPGATPGPPPPPGAKPAPPPAPKKSDGGLNTLDDLSNMIGGS